MSESKRCKFDGCGTPATDMGWCPGHYKQHRLGQELHPKKGSREFYEAQLNENREKKCTRCGYWLPLVEYHTDVRSVSPEYGRAHCKRCHILRRMNLTARDFDEILERQGGRCAICRTQPDPASNRNFVVDHDHACCPGMSSCGRCIRGILCNSCNALLGFAGDDRSVLGAAIGYLSEVDRDLT